LHAIDEQEATKKFVGKERNTMISEIRENYPISSFCAGHSPIGTVATSLKDARS
jgi:hypothetical protein